MILIAILKVSPNTHTHTIRKSPHLCRCKHFLSTVMSIAVKLAIFQNTSSKKQNTPLICRIIYLFSVHWLIERFYGTKVTFFL